MHLIFISTYDKLYKSLAQWLSEDFTSYMEKSVEARQGYSDQQKQRNLISDLTLEGISITGMLYIDFYCTR